MNQTTRGQKRCSQCGETKPLSEFYRSARGADGVRSQCKDCNRGDVKARYVPRVRSYVRKTCPQCGNEFSYQPTSGPVRVYCSRKCTVAHGEELKIQRNEGRPPRVCACGSTDVARVGKPVCPSCQKDPRSEAARLALKAREAARRLAAYGLTRAEYEGLVTRQQNRCAICRTATPGGKGEAWHIDHDHATGVVRGLLCHACNTGLGSFRDKPELLLAAIQYVTAHQATAEAA